MHSMLQIAQVCALVAVAALIWLAVRAFRKNVFWGLSVLLLSPVAAIVFAAFHWKGEKPALAAYFTSFAAALGLGLYVFTAWGGWDVVQSAVKVHQGIKSRTLDERDAYAFAHANLNFIEKARPDEQGRRRVEMMRRFVNQHEQGMNELGREILLDDLEKMMQDEGLDEQQRRELAALQSRLAEDDDAGQPEAETAATGSPDSEAAVTEPAQAEAPAPETATTAAAPSPAENGKPKSRRPSQPKRNYRVDYREIEVSQAKNFVGKSFKVTRRGSEEREGRLIGVSPGKLRFEQRGRGGTFTFEFRYRDIERLKLLAMVED